MPKKITSSPLPPGMPDRCDLEWPAILKSKGLIEPASRSKGSKVGALVCPETTRLILTASDKEHMAIQTCYAESGVKVVREQAARIPYRNADNEKHEHVIDIIAETHDGLNVGILVKDGDVAAKTRLCDFVELLEKYTPKSVADCLIYMTNYDLPEFHVRNAQHFLSVRRDERTPFDDYVREAAPAVTQPTVIRDFTAQFGGGEFAFRPVMRAIFFGTFSVLTQGLIDADSVIQFSGTVMPDRDFERLYPLLPHGQPVND